MGADGDAAGRAAAATDGDERGDVVPQNVREQVEYYFADENLPRDEVLLAHVEADPDGQGWVAIDYLLTFYRLRGWVLGYKNLSKSMATIREEKITDDQLPVLRETVAAAVETSDVIKLNAARTHIARREPVPSKESLEKRSVVLTFGPKLPTDEGREEEGEGGGKEQNGEKVDGAEKKKSKKKAKRPNVLRARDATVDVIRAYAASCGDRLILGATRLLNRQSFRGSIEFVLKSEEAAKAVADEWQSAKTEAKQRALFPAFLGKYPRRQGTPLDGRACG